MASKERVVSLRMAGFSIREICDSLKAPKATVSYYCKGLRPNNAPKVSTGEATKASAAKHKERRDNTRNAALSSWSELKLNAEYLALLSAYWGEGKKSHPSRIPSFCLTNSDPAFIKAGVMSLLGIGIAKDRLLGYVKVYSEHNQDECQARWEAVLGIRCVTKLVTRRKPNKLRSKYGVCDLLVTKSTLLMVQILTHLQCWRNELSGNDGW